MTSVTFLLCACGEYAVHMHSSKAQKHQSAEPAFWKQELHSSSSAAGGPRCLERTSDLESQAVLLSAHLMEVDSLRLGC